MMGIKKTLGLGVASAALGLSLIGGGTFAYFSDTAQHQQTFAAGTLDLTTDPSVGVTISNLKPGDSITKKFKLKNSGTLNIGSILLNTSTRIVDVGGNNGNNDLAKFIKVQFLTNLDKGLPNVGQTVVYEKTLDELKNLHPDLQDKSLFNLLFGEAEGIKAGTDDSFEVRFVFVDNNQDQNYFQGDSLELTWNFEAKQTKAVNY